MGFILVVVQLLTVLISTFSSGLTGFGQATIFQTVNTVLGNLGLEGAGNLRDGLAIVSICGYTSCLMIGRDTWRANEIRWNIVAGLFPGSLIFYFAGTAALVALNQSVLKKALGLLFLVFACYQLVMKCKGVVAEKKKVQLEFVMEQEEEKERERKAANAAADAAESSIVGIDTAPLHSTSTFLSPTSSSSTTVTSASAAATLADPLPSASHPDVDWPGAAPTAAETSPDLDIFMSPTVPTTTTLIQVAEADGSINADPSHTLASSSSSAAASTSSSTASIPTSQPLHSPRTILMSPALWLSSLYALILTREWQLAMLTGSVAGFIGGCFGTNGPPILVYFSLINITKGQIRGTFAWMSIFMIIPSFISLTSFGIWKSENWYLYLMLPPTTIAGVYFGGRLHKRIDTTIILMLLQGIVLLSTIALCDAFDGSTFGDFMMVVYGMIAISLAVFTAYNLSMNYRFLEKHQEYTLSFVEYLDKKKKKEKEAKRRAMAIANGTPLDERETDEWHY